MDPRIIGKEHYDVATAVQKILQDYKSLQDIIAILGMDELSEEDKLTVRMLWKYEPPYLYCVSFRSSVRVKSNVSCRNLSRSLRSLPVTRANSFP